MNTNDKLRQTLAKMLPEQLRFVTYRRCAGDSDDDFSSTGFYWLDQNGKCMKCVEDTELLHLCWLIQETLTPEEWTSYTDTLLTIVGKDMNGYNHYWEMCARASWQQRVKALAYIKIRGINL